MWRQSCKRKHEFQQGEHEDIVHQETCACRATWTGSCKGRGSRKVLDIGVRHLSWVLRDIEEIGRWREIGSLSIPNKGVSCFQVRFWGHSFLIYKTVQKPHIYTAVDAYGKYVLQGGIWHIYTRVPGQQCPGTLWARSRRTGRPTCWWRGALTSAPHLPEKWLPGKVSVEDLVLVLCLSNCHNYLI